MSATRRGVTSDPSLASDAVGTGGGYGVSTQPRSDFVGRPVVSLRMGGAVSVGDRWQDETPCPFGAMAVEPNRLFRSL